MKINRQRLKEIIRSVIAEEKSYEEFFRGELEKAGFSSPAEMSDAEKREFFNRIDSEWKAKNEELVGNQHKLDIDGDGEIEASDLAALRAGKKKEKSSNEGNAFGAAVTKAKKEGDKKFKVGGKTYPVKEQKSKYYVEIDSPREVDSNRVKGEIKSFMRRGARSAEIGLRMNFLTTNPKDMMNKFQKVKNHVYFANDPMRFESVDEGVMKPGKKIKLISGWAGQNQPTKNDKYVIYQLVNNRHFSMRGLRGGMTYLWKAIESTDPHIKVGSTEEIHPKALKQGIKHGFYVMESVIKEGRHDKDLDKVEAAVKNASSFMGVGAELKKAGIKYDFSTSMMPMYRIKVAGNTIAIVNKRYASGAEREVGDIAIGLLEGKIGRSLKVEGLSPDVAKHMVGIHKGFQKVEGDGTMIYDTPANAKKAADFLNKKKVAASSDGKYLYIESKTRR